MLQYALLLKDHQTLRLVHDKVIKIGPRLICDSIIKLGQKCPVALNDVFFTFLSGLLIITESQFMVRAEHEEQLW